MHEFIPKGTSGVQTIIVRHDAWCPMAYGEGDRCAAGCGPRAEQVSWEVMAETMARDFKNRAQRREAAKAARRAKR
jgi:hypothetical protein